MPSDYVTPSIEAGEAIRHLHPLRRWVEIREFYQAILRRYPSRCANLLTTLTICVWDHPERYR